MFNLSKVILFSTLLSSAFAQAQLIIQEKNWALSLQTTASAPEGICVMSSVEKVKKTQYSLEIMKRKTADSVTEVFIRQIGSDVNATGLVVTPEEQKNIHFSFPKLMGDGAQVTTFYHIPRFTQALFQNLINKNSLRVYSRGIDKEVKFSFSHKGFAKVFAIFQAQCLDNAPQAQTEFESQFLANAQANINPLALDIKAVERLRSLFSEGFMIFRSQKQNQFALLQLQNQFLSQLQESERLTSLTGRISKQLLPQLRANLSQSEINQRQAESDLVKVNGQIPGYEQELRQAQARYQEALRVISPYVEEYNSRANSLAAAEDVLDQAIQRLRQIEAGIRTLQQEVAALEDEANRLQYSFARLREELNRAEYEFREAVRANRGFDWGAEVRRRLDNDFSYQNLLREISDSRRELERLEVIRRGAQVELQKRQEELRACQGIVGQECPQQAAAVAQAESNLNSATQAASNQRSQLESQQRQAERVRSAVEGDVRKIKDRFEEAERASRQRRDQIADQLSQTEIRLQIIIGSELPSRHQSLQQLQNERPQVQSQINFSQAQVQQSENELRSFRARVGWDSKKQELDSATQMQSLKDSQLVSARDLKSRLERQIVAAKTEQESLKAEILKQSQILSQSQARLSALSVELQPYVSRKAQLDQLADSLQAQFIDRKTQFESMLPRF